MKSKLRFRLSIVMIVSAILFSFAIATVDHFIHREQIIKRNKDNIEHIEDSVVEALRTIDKAYTLFNEDTDRLLEKNTRYLLSMYEKAPNLENWDFDQLSETLGVDIYIINEKNVITNSSVRQDVGLDFRRCCATLSNILDERRKTGELYIDNMDVEQYSGEVKKFSYMATHDKKYLIELSLSLEDDPVFSHFNFLPIVEELKEKYAPINEINILNLGGLLIGQDNQTHELSEERRTAFFETRTTGSTTEVVSEWDVMQKAIYRYVYYESASSIEDTDMKVIEIIYNNSELQMTLQKNFIRFIFQLVIVLAIIAVIAYIIHRWVSKQVYYAYHDSLTKLKNRTAFDEQFAGELKNSTGLTALMMIDLDNFKLVNDYLGHLKGDYLLQLVAKTLQGAIGKPYEAFRLGGDEFAILMPRVKDKEIHDIAEAVINSLTKSISEENELKGLNITASIGISVAPKDGRYPETLYKKADIAMYNAKEKGKNRYQVYTEKFEKENIW